MSRAIQKLLTCCDANIDSPSITSERVAYQSQPRRERVVQARMGVCNFTLKNNTRCGCLEGICTSDYSNVPQARCENCDHLMSMHADFVSAPTHDNQVNISAPADVPELPVAQAAPVHSEIFYRRRTVEELARLLECYRVVHLRGTPASGKSTLALQLRDYYMEQQEIAVLITGWPNDIDAVLYLVKKCHDAGAVSVNTTNFRQSNVVLIFDEAQASYGDSSLWLGLIKTQSGGISGPRLCLFSSFGSPDSGHSSYPPGTTPVFLGPVQRVSIRPSCIPGSPQISLFYAKDEFEKVVERRCNLTTAAFSIDSPSREYLFTITSGHPGAVFALLEYIYRTYRSDLKHSKVAMITLPLVVKALSDEHTVFSALLPFAISRSFPHKNRLTSDAADTLRKVLEVGSVARNLDDDGISLCYSMGWLHAEPLDQEAADVVCIFPTKLHEKYVEYYLTLRDPKPFPLETYPTLPHLCEAVLRNFSRSSIYFGGQMISGGQSRPQEALYQDEFYRSYKALLGSSSAISSEWARPKCGRIDFKIPGPGWGVELVKDGDRLSDHCQRFESGGIYYPLICDGSLKDWLIIDCTRKTPQKYAVPGTKLWRAVFNSDYSRARVLDRDNNEVANLPLFE